MVLCNGTTDGCCNSDCPCGENEGDCDNDSECDANLKCGQGNGFDDNCPNTFPSWSDCCYDPEERRFLQKKSKNIIHIP